jgi:hypothetical protein
MSCKEEWVNRRLRQRFYAKETGLNPSQIVNIAVETFFQTKANEHLKEAVKNLV